ncbi:MAG: glycosyltransferase family 4 protein [Candidatus Diapherotrites archaeon]
MNIPKKLNILSIGEYPPFPGGSSGGGLSVCEELTKLGHHVTIVTQTVSGKEFPTHSKIKFVPVETKRVLDVDPKLYEIIRWHKQFRGLGGEIARIPFVEAMKREIKQQRPDVILVNYGVPYLHFVLPLAKKEKIPVITILSGSDVHTLPTRPYRKVKKPLLNAYRNSDGLITISDYLKNILHQLGVKNAVTIRNAIDTTVFHPLDPREKAKERAELGIRENETVFVHVSTLKPIKDPLRIVEAAAIALRKNPNLHFLIVGDGELRGAMEKLAQEKNVRNKFKFVGTQKPDRVRKYLGLADCFVISSLNEGLANVILEAQAVGIPTIASIAGAMPEIVKHNETGLLFEPRNAEDFAKCMVQMSNPTVRERLTRNARKASKNISLEKMGQIYHEFILRTIALHESRGKHIPREHLPTGPRRH